jgi:C4-dicarboxylate transporter DctQ subunit
MFNRLEEGAIAFLLAAMTLLTFTQVVLRFVFNTGLGWALEATVYLFAWLVLIGISYGVRVGAHIGVSALVDRLPKLGQRITGGVAGLCTIIYGVLFTMGSLDYIDTVYLIGVTGEDIPIPRWMLIIILPIGFGLLTIRLTEATWRNLRGDELGIGLADEVADAMKLQAGDTDVESDTLDPVIKEDSRS